MRETHVVIIGGGITGLSAAYKLKQQAQQKHLSLRCTLIEKDNQLGGKIRTHRENGFVMEEGPDSILARKPAGVGLIRELGVESEMVGSNPAALKTFILYKGHLEPIPPGTNMGIPMEMKPFASTNLVSLPGKARALMDLVLPRTATTSGDMSLGAFLRRRLGDDVVGHIVEPLLAGIYAGSVDELSLDATFPQFRQLERNYRSLILGSIAQRKKMAGAAATGGPSAKTGRSAFVTLNSGLYTIIERLYDELHEWADLRTQTSVTAVAKAEGGKYAVTVSGPHGTETLTADALIVSTPATVAGQLLEPLAPDAGVLKQVQYVSTATVLLAYHKEGAELEAVGNSSGFVIPRSENRAITACTLTSSKWPHTTPGGHTLIRCYVGRRGQQEGLHQDDTGIIEMVRGELRDILGITATPWFTHLTRWNNAMPQYAVNHLQLVQNARSALHRQTPGVFVAGAAYHGVGVPDCIEDAAEAVDKVMTHLYG